MTRLSKALLCVLTSVVVVVASVAIAQSECTAAIEVDKTHEDEEGEHKRFRFEVRITTEEDCARVVYDVIVEEFYPNGQTRKIRISKQVKIDDGSIVEIVGHEMPANFKMLGYEGKIVECVPCALFPDE